MVATRKREHAQKVVPLADRVKIATWMADRWKRPEERQFRWKDEVIQQFPETFKGEPVRNSRQKVVNWWNARQRYVDADENHGISYVSAKKGVGRTKKAHKALTGRGRKKDEVTQHLYELLNAEWRRFKLMKLETSYHSLSIIAKKLLSESDHEVFNAAYRKSPNDTLYIEKVNYDWALRFCESSNYVLRAKGGKPELTEAGNALMEKRVAYHLGGLKRSYDAKRWTNETMRNFDETHLLQAMERQKMLAEKGTTCVKALEVVSGSKGFSGVLVLGEEILPSMVIFQNDLRSYPIRGIADDIDGITYRSAPKGFMDQRVMADFLRSNKIWGTNRKKIHLWCDNYGSHEKQVNLARSVNIELHFLPRNSTHLTQPADSFVIKAVKADFMKRWELYKTKAVLDGNTTEGGKVNNPGKHWYLETLKDSIEAVNKKRYGGLSAAKKAMIECGLNVPDTGIWSVSMLKKPLQRIVAKHPEYFSHAKNPNKLIETEQSGGEGDESDGESEASATSSDSVEYLGELSPKQLASMALDGFGDDVPVSTILKYFAKMESKSEEDLLQTFADTKVEKAANMARRTGKLDSHTFGDEMSLEEFRARFRTVVSTPLALASISDVQAVRDADALGMQDDLKREVPEVHSLNVGKLAQLVQIAARKDGVNLLPYEVLDPMSCIAPSLRDVPATDAEQVQVQVIHTPFHFTTLVLTTRDLKRAAIDSQNEASGAVYMNSLSDLDKSVSIDAENIDSPIIHDLCDGYCTKLTEIPSLQQPYGHSCGMACNLNAMLALAAKREDNLVDLDLNIVAQQFGWPKLNAWTNQDFCCATQVLVEVYRLGRDDVPTLSALMKRIGNSVNAKRIERAEARKKQREEAAKKKAQKNNKRASVKGQSSLHSFLKKRKTDASDASPEQGAEKRKAKAQARDKESGNKKKPTRGAKKTANASEQKGARVDAPGAKKKQTLASKKKQKGKAIGRSALQGATAKKPKNTVSSRKGAKQARTASKPGTTVAKKQSGKKNGRKSS